ncbi:MAG: ComEA family DNA-binding protein [Chloroflexia bacterium]
MERWRHLVWILVPALFLAGLGVSRGWTVTQPQTPSPRPILVVTPTPEPSPTPLPTATPAPVVVYVSGAVVRPGVYALPAGARVADALAAAGGATAEADLVHLNLARRLHDEEQVYVPRKGEPTPVWPTGAPSSGGGGRSKVNINTAGVAELDTLPGIGPGYAQRIVDYRQQHGPFRTIEDLQKVPGIGPATFARIRDLITVE